MRLRHAQQGRLAVHHGHEGGDRAAHMLGDGDGVVPRGQHQAVEQVAQRQLFALPQVHRTLADRGGGVAGRHHVVEAAILDGQQGGHNLRRAGHGQAGVGVLGIEDLSVRHIIQVGGASEHGRVWKDVRRQG